jgi:hypothetical protein
MTNTTSAADSPPKQNREGGRWQNVSAAVLRWSKPNRQLQCGSRFAWNLPRWALSMRFRIKQIGRHTLSIVDAMLAVETELFAQPPAIETIDVLTSKLHG